MPTPEPRRGDGISLVMLAIAAASSATAAFVVSRVWGTGTLLGAAVTPIIVAVVTEVLRRPATRVPDVRAPATPRRSGEPPVHVYRSAPGAREWRIVALTALAAFVIGVGLYVGLDRLAGGSGRLVPERGHSPPAQTRTATSQTTKVVTQRTVTISTVTVERDRTVVVPETVTAPPATTPTVPTQTQATAPTSTGP